MRETDWTQIAQASGLTHAAFEVAAKTYAKAKSLIAIYGMGLTQHKLGVDTVQMLTSIDVDVESPANAAVTSQSIHRSQNVL